MAPSLTELTVCCGSIGRKALKVRSAQARLSGLSVARNHTGAWNQARHHVEYFWKNRDNGIVAFEDTLIRAHLALATGGGRMTFGQIVNDYVLNYRGEARAEMETFSRERNRAAAIRRAALYEFPDRKRHPHQCLIPRRRWN
jgi:hypothetical protein